MKTLLIANRGEIACRIMRTARALGIRTVAVYSETDANAQHVVQADVAIALAGETAAETYLDIDQIVSCLLYTSPSPRDRTRSRMPSSA